MLTLERIMEERATAQETIKAYEHVEKLHKNASFKKIILEGYFKDAAVRSAPLLAQPANSPVRAGAENTMIGIGALQMYFSALYNKAVQAEEYLVELDEAERELAAGE